MVAMVAMVVGKNVCYTCNEMINKLSPQLRALIMCPQILNCVGVYLTRHASKYCRWGAGASIIFKCAVVPCSSGKLERKFSFTDCSVQDVSDKLSIFERNRQEATDREVS